MDNINKLQKSALESNKVGRSQDPVAVEKFGFPVTTCCGFIPQNNEWLDDWVVSVFPTQVFFHLRLENLWYIHPTCTYQAYSQSMYREPSNCLIRLN